MATTLRLSLLAVLVAFAFAEFTEDSTEEYYDYYQEGFNGPYKALSVCINEDGRLFTKDGTDCDQRVALGKFRNAINQTGWSFLEVETSSDFEPEIQAYAAGVVEGILTRELITYQWRNTREDYCKEYEGYCRRLSDYLKENMKWIRSQLIAKPRNDLYWNQVNLTLTQMTGISHGYEDRPLAPEVSFDVSRVLVLNAAGEFFDLETVLNRTKDVPPSDGTEGEDHCTGFVKITPGNKDLLFAQVAMNKLNTMTRVLKLIKMGYDKTQVPGHTSSFSSYPGSLTSFDDFSLMSSGVGNVETTHKIYNRSLYDHVSPVGQLGCWLRNVVANKLANTAKDWAKIFARYNSGTYNNQWTIVDYKTFTPGKELPSKGVLHVLEQIPGTVLHKDMTWYLKKHSYWLSYNIPYFLKIREMTGAVAQAKKVGAWSDFDNAPRAKIARRDHHKVIDIDSMTKFMRYNDYQNDPLSLCSEYQTTCNPPYSAEAAMSARGDLNLPNGTYELTGQGFQNHAGLDYKGTNAEMMKKLRFRAWSGPTYDPLPPFNWKKTNIPGKHFGMPDEWKFDYVDVEWETPIETALD